MLVPEHTAGKCVVSGFKSRHSNIISVIILGDFNIHPLILCPPSFSAFFLLCIPVAICSILFFEKAEIPQYSTLQFLSFAFLAHVLQCFKSNNPSIFNLPSSSPFNISQSLEKGSSTSLLAK